MRSVGTFPHVSLIHPCFFSCKDRQQIESATLRDSTWVPHYFDFSCHTQSWTCEKGGLPFTSQGPTKITSPCPYVQETSIARWGPGSSYKWGEITPINSIDVPSKKQVSHVFCYFVSWVIQLHFIRLQLPVQLLDRLDLLSRDMRTEMRSMSSRRFVGRFGRFGGWSMLQLFGVWGGVAGDDHVS